jgi:hypothetical protein
MLEVDEVCPRSGGESRGADVAADEFADFVATRGSNLVFSLGRQKRPECVS